jgi:hypothetical protein
LDYLVFPRQGFKRAGRPARLRICELNNKFVDVKVLIEIPPEHYDLFVAECDIASRDYTVLKNSVVANDAPLDPDRRVIQILCDEDEALSLLATASRVYPQVVPAIRAALAKA